EAIFEPFTQASSSTTRNFGGTGLGLAIVKKLLTLFDSKINLESTPGIGSNFFFDISFTIDKQPAAVYATTVEPDYDLSALRVLIAEDNPMNRLLMKKVFSKWSNVPVFAVNGQEAIEKATCEVFDVILMDIHMPVVDGYDAAKAIRNLTDSTKSNVPIIALTASVSNDLSEKITSVGMNDYVFKPFKSKELYSKLNMIAIGS
ncbi:MAG: response regulator, partial [Daejeonella sp.]|nr:response regulator [Daejeonella sp.]